MKTAIFTVTGMLVLTIAACVTINVYFPEAAASEAADRFIEDVIGPDMQPADRNPQAGLGWRVLDFFLPAAHAQVDIRINTPEIRAIQQRMAQRFEAELRSHFDSGAIGFTNDAMIAVRDLSKVGLRDRSALNAAVAADNRDRQAVYREIAVANGHPEWEAQIRATFATEWVNNARAGWFYQNPQGNWVQK